MSIRNYLPKKINLFGAASRIQKNVLACYLKKYFWCMNLLLEIIIFSLLVWKLEHSILIPHILLIRTKSKFLALSILSTKVGKHLCLLRVRRVHQLCLLSTKMCSSMYYMYKTRKKILEVRDYNHRVFIV